MGSMRVACVAIVKNEARHLSEWLAWQFCVGFDAVVLLDHGSTDATQTVAGTMALGRDVRLVPWAMETPDFQMRAYEYAAGLLAEEFDWLAFFDADEFLRLDEGLELKALLAARAEAAVAVPWAIFGSAGHREMPDGLTIEAFTRRADQNFPPNRHVKSIVRPQRVRRAENPHVFEVDGVYVDLLGRPVAWGHFPGYLAMAPDYAGGALNRYFTRSWAHWQAKMARGHLAITRTEAEFFENDRNEVEDVRAAARAPEVRAVMAGAGGAKKYRFSICACARWESAYIVEWLCYYRALGFEHVFLYCNDDDPEEFYARVLPFTQGPAPFVTFRYHAAQGEQFEMYLHFLRHGLEETEWISFFDIDEFLRLPPGESIGAFMSHFAAHADCVLFNWVFFGPNGHKVPPAGGVLENFTRRQERLHPYTKYVARAAVFEGLDLSDRNKAHGFWHEIGTKVTGAVRTLNPLGEDMARYYDWFEAGSREFVNEPARRQRLLEMAVVHHYAFRSELAFWEREARGVNADFEGQYIWRRLAEGPDFVAHLAGWNAVPDMRLAAVWRQLLSGAKAHDTRAETRAQPFSRYKRTTASSLAEGAPGGVVDGGGGAVRYRTMEEAAPWWQVDLAALVTIAEIRVAPGGGMGAPLGLGVSIDGEAWVELARFEGAGPFVWNGPGSAWGRYVRVTLAGDGALALCQVDVFAREGAA
jgi:glycosyltransferase involved in cell wall biosynthesis